MFTRSEPSQIARSLKKAPQTNLTAARPIRSDLQCQCAVNRAGRVLPERLNVVLKDAKGKLRKEFGKQRQRALDLSSLRGLRTCLLNYSSFLTKY
ncbi:DUF3175 domain-containing protein [Agrobacterium sp. CCNWLW32]|uniref:DUF3175 domain-containing protein n=1 Tax=Agrobacterium sp. CCNWLW32 TaxID=3122072 RepID=UPI003FA529F1